MRGQKIGKTGLYALVAAAWLAAWPASARAQSAHVENRCPKLSLAEYDELDARVLLLFANEGVRTRCRS